MFNTRLNAKHLKRKYQISICFSESCRLYVISCLFIFPLIFSGDIELNPGPRKRDCYYNLSLCHWNPNNITPHNFSKFILLKTYNMKHNFYIICISETYVNSSIQHDDERLHKWIKSSQSGQS